MADFSKFRTAVSGFNRTDVVNYIESASMEHQKALRKLTDERDKLAAENAQLQTQLTGLQARLIQVQADNDALTEQVNTLAQEGSDLAEQLKAAEAARAEAAAQPQPAPSDGLAANKTEASPCISCTTRPVPASRSVTLNRSVLSGFAILASPVLHSVNQNNKPRKKARLIDSLCTRAISQSSGRIHQPALDRLRRHHALQALRSKRPACSHRASTCTCARPRP